MDEPRRTRLRPLKPMFAYSPPLQAVPQRVVDKMLRGAAKAEPKDADQGKKPRRYRGLEEREKGFEPSTLAWAIRSPVNSLVTGTVHHRPSPCNSEGLADPLADAIVQIRPQSSTKGRPALHQTTTPATVPFWHLKAAELSVLLTVKAVADRLKVSRATVYGLVRRGELPSVRVSKPIRVPRDAVEALVI